MLCLEESNLAELACYVDGHIKARWEPWGQALESRLNLSGDAAMEYDKVIRILGAEAVTGVEGLVDAIYVRAGDKAEAKAALIELLLAMIAAVVASERDTPEFRSKVDEIAERLRSICSAVQEQGTPSRQ